MNKILIAIGAAVLAAIGVGVYVERKRAAPIGQAIVEKMQSILGTPYLWGGKNIGHGGLDCSGAVTWALQEMGLVPAGFAKSADQLYRMSSRVLIPQVGDLAFYGSPDHVSHVMVVAPDGRVIGATGGGSQTTSVEVARAHGAEVKYEPANYRKDIVAYGRLPFTLSKET